MAQPQLLNYQQITGSWSVRLFNPLIGILASSGAVAAGGSYESIATVSVGSGGASDITFTSIPNTYKHLQLRILERGTDSSGYDAFVQFNSDTGSNYAWHLLWGDGGNANAAGLSSQSRMFGTQGASAALTSGIFAVSIIDILDYSSTTKYKTLRTLEGRDSNGAGAIGLGSGLWQNTAAVSTIKYYKGTGNLAQYTHAALYGIKD